MEDAGPVGLLVAHHVGPPAQQRPKVHVGARRVGDHRVARATKNRPKISCFMSFKFFPTNNIERG